MGGAPVVRTTPGSVPGSSRRASGLAFVPSIGVNASTARPKMAVTVPRKQRSRRSPPRGCVPSLHLDHRLGRRQLGPQPATSARSFIVSENVGPPSAPPAAFLALTHRTWMVNVSQGSLTQGDASSRRAPPWPGTVII
jgi:hypothetical protein